MDEGGLVLTTCGCVREVHGFLVGPVLYGGDRWGRGGRRLAKVRVHVGSPWVPGRQVPTTVVVTGTGEVTTSVGPGDNSLLDG